MRARTLYSLLFVGALSASVPPLADASHSPTEALVLIQQAQEEAQALDRLLHRGGHHAGLQRRLQRRLQRLERLLDDLEGEIREPRRRRGARDGGFSGMIVVEDLADVPVDLPMRTVDLDRVQESTRTSEADLQRILTVLETESFSDGKLSALRTVIPNRSFTVNQVIELLEAFDFGDDKVNAASLLYGQVEDPNNWYLVYGALDFDSDREALRRRTGL